MTQPILLGLEGAILSLVVALLGLIGVLVKTQVDYKLGRRTGDIAEVTADASRATQLSEDNRKQREEILKLFATERDLRREIAEKEEMIVRLNAEANAALRAQERAEGGLVVARQTIQDICPSLPSGPDPRP